MIGHEFPYTNLHDVNIDWILQVVKEFNEKYHGIDDAIDAAIASLEAKAEELETAMQEYMQGLEEETTANINEIYAQFQLEANEAIQAIISNKELAIEAIDSEMNSKLAQVSTLLNSLPHDYQDALNQMQIINATLNGTNNYPELVQGHYADSQESDSKTLVPDNYRVSSLLSAGCASRKLRTRVTNANGIIRDIIYWTGWGDSAVSHPVPVSTSTTDEKTLFTYTFPANATYFTVVFASDYNMLTAIAPSDLQVNFQWIFDSLETLEIDDETDISGNSDGFILSKDGDNLSSYTEGTEKTHIDVGHTNGTIRHYFKDERARSDIEDVTDELTNLQNNMYGYVEEVETEIELVPNNYFNMAGVFRDGETTYYKGDTSYLTLEGTYCKRITVSNGEKYKIYGIGASNSIGLYILTDINRNIISSEKLGSRETPITLEIEAAGYLYVNLYNYNSETDKVVTIAEIIHEGIEDKIDKPWNGKTIVLFGDSMTEFTDNDGKRYSDYLQELSGATIINCGIGGTQLRQRTTPTANPSDINEGYAGLDIVNMILSCCNNNFTIMDACAEYIKTTQGDDNTAIVARAKAIDWNIVDAVVVLGGTNDWNNGHYLGTDLDTTADTTLGAIGIIIQTLLSTFTHVKLYWFTPLVRWLASSLAQRTPENWAGNAENGREHVTLPAYVDAIINKVKSQSIPVCDMYYTLGWNMYNFSAYFNDNDGTHPRKGNNEIAQKIYAFMTANKTF